MGISNGLRPAKVITLSYIVATVIGGRRPTDPRDARKRAQTAAVTRDV